MASWRLGAVGWALVAAVLVGCCGGRYIITTPQEWVVGGTAQVCVEVDDPSAPAGYLDVLANRTYYRGEDSATLIDVTFPIPAGSVFFCKDIEVPPKDHYRAKLWLRGEVAGDYVNRTMTIDLRSNMYKTYIQTDKYLYRPGQKVQMRILTLHFTNFTVSTRQYPEVWMTTPSRTRIAQWNNVDNSAGLIHLKMTLADEPEQGRYKISVKGLDGKIHDGYFKVAEYNVPRFEVTVEAVKKFYSSDHSISVKICARYTYGQPVRGNFTLEVNNFIPSACWVAKNITGPINGCQNVSIAAAKLRVVDCEVQTLVFKAMVTEAGTWVVQSGKANVPVNRQAVTFRKIYQNNVKKPGLPYYVKVRAERPDGTPAGGIPVELCKGDICSNLTVPNDGMIIISVVKKEFKSIQMKALNTRVMLDEATFYTTVKQYYSPSNSSLLIYTPDKKLQCAEKGAGSEYLLPVFFISDQSKAAFTVQVISKYVQYYTKTEEFDLTPGELPIRPEEEVEPLEEPPLGTFRGVIYIPITLNDSISPSAKVIVWTVRPDGEVVSDAQDLEMERCLPNKVELTWIAVRPEPGKDAIFLIRSAPGSLCSLGVVDKGTLLLDTRTNTLTLKNIFRSLEYSQFGRLFFPSLNDAKYCRHQLGLSDDESSRYITRHYDALAMLTGSGLHVLSDLVLETRPCERRPEITDYYYYPEHVAYNSAKHREHIGIPGEVRTRSHFPETWLWDLYAIKPSVDMYGGRATLPDTITEWVGQAVCVHPQQGLGLSQLSNVTTFMPFFQDVTLPPSIKRGETLGVLISIFNYMEVSIPVDVRVSRKPEYEIIVDPSVNLLGNEFKVCIEGNSKVVLEVKVKPTSLGHINITVISVIDHRSDNVCGAPPPTFQYLMGDILEKPITVKAEGFLREKTWNKYICAKDLEDGSDSLGRWDVEAPGGIVEGSDRGWVTVVGSLLSISLENLGHLIRMPYGCGEQNMVNFAPNVFILQYLTITRQATVEAVTKLTSFMNKGYQRQLLYLRSNGSYSAFGNADPTGSTWLTAFVVKSFAQAQPFITIDSDKLRHSIEWLNSTQGSDGCFNSVGTVFSKALKGGLDLEVRETLTAYVLTALLEAGEERTSFPVLNAASCLLSRASPSQHPYSLALRAYGLALAGLPEAEETLKSLMAQAVVTSNSTHWELPVGYSRSDSLLVETAGYAIMAMITLDAQGYEEQIRKVVKWITAQRNGQGGYYTTQDTVVALQALAKYESTQYQEEIDFVATIKGTGIDHSFAVNEDNKLVTQRASLTTLPTSLSLTIVGKGCAVFQSVLRYNVYEPDSSDAFNLTIKAETAADRTCTTKWINACASYHLHGETSNMVVVAVDLVSGYVPLKDDLKKIIKNNPGVVKRYEIDGSQVSFYIKELSSGQRVCLPMRVTRLVEVEGAKPGSVTVYDYYQPEFSISKIYSLPPNDECIYTQ